jgi:hypothetical protein
MQKTIGKILKWALVSLLVIGVALLALRSFRVLGGPPLQPWHTFVPQELRADQLDAADWTRYLAQENEIMASVRAEVSQKLAPDQRVPINRYFEASPVYPARFAHDWNRSYVMEPDGKPLGDIIVLAHKPAYLTYRVARAIADADGNLRPGCVYIKLADAAKAAMSVDGAK